MAIRGLFGFHYRNKYYVIYNYSDSFPHGLGDDIVRELKAAIAAHRLDIWKSKIARIKIIDSKIPPTPEEIEKLRVYANLKVSGQKYSDWYCLLHKCQGSLERMLASGYIDNCVNANGIPDWTEYDSDFGYIVNLDTEKLEFYRGRTLDESYDFDALPDWSDYDEELWRDIF